MEKVKALLKNEYLVKYKAIILAVFSIIICLVIFFTITLPQFQKIQENRKNLSDIREKDTFFQQKYQKLGQVQPDDYKKNLEASLLALPDDKDIPGIIGQLINLVSSNQLKLDGMNFLNPAAQANTVNNYQIKLEVSGGTDNIKKFINDLKASPRLVKLSSVTLSSVGSSNNNSSSGIEVTTFYEALPASAGGLEQDVKLLSEQDLADLSKLRALIRPGSGSDASIESTGSGKLDPFQ